MKMEKIPLESKETESAAANSTTGAAASYPEFGENFVSVDGILCNNDIQELLASASSGRTESLTLYKSEPDPLDNFGEESVNFVNTDDSDLIEDSTLTPKQELEDGEDVPLDEEGFAEIPSEEEETPSPTPIFGEDEEELRPRRQRNRKGRLVNERVFTIPRVIGSLEQIRNATKTTKDVDFFVRQNIEEYLVRRGFRQNQIIPVDKPGSNLNTVSFGPQYEAREISGEIEKFWKFYCAVKLENTKYSEELKPMLIPLLLNFYDECFLAGETVIALRLYTEYGNQFLTEDNTKNNYQILFTISKVSSVDEFKANQLIQSLRRKDNIFVLHNATFERLKMFLRSTGCPALVNLFANRFIIRVAESEVQPTYEEPPSSTAGRNEDENNFGDENPADSYQITERLKSSVLANVPTLSFYATNGSITSGALSAQASILAYGMASGEIRISFTSKRVLNNVNLTRRRTRRKRRLLRDVGNVEADDSSTMDDLLTINDFKGHDGSVSALTFHPKTMLLFSVGQDTKMKAWDVHDLKCRATYGGHTAPIWCVDQTLSGHMLVTGSMDSTARIWVPERSEYVRLLAGHYFDVDCVKFHPNEAYVATGSLDKSVRLWSVVDGSMVRVFTGMNSPITSIQFHESGKYLIGASEDPVILVWDIAESEVIAEIPSPPFCRDISLAGNMLSGCFANNTVVVWNIYPIVGGSGDSEVDPYNAEEEDAQTYKLRSPKIFECARQTKSLVKLFYRDMDNLYCLGESLGPSESLSDVKRKYCKNPLSIMEGILGRRHLSQWPESDSENSGSELTPGEEPLSQAVTSIRYIDSNENEEEGNGYDREEVYQFYN